MKIFILVLATIIILFLLVDFFFVLLLDRKSINDKKEDETKDKDETINDFIIEKKDYKIPDVNGIFDVDLDDDHFHKMIFINNMESINKLFSKEKLKCECINYYENGIITTYEIKVEDGQLIDDITKLEDKIKEIINTNRIDFIIPFQNNTIGFIVKNEKINDVKFISTFNYLLSKNSKKPLLIPIGKDLVGNYQLLDLLECHNLVIGGDIGSGKSTFLQNIICSLLLKTTPNEVRFVCIDTKGSELYLYDSLDNFIGNCVSDKDKAFSLMEEVIDEIYRRVDIIDNNMDDNIEEYNQEVNDWNKDHLLEEEKKDILNYIVFIIDDFSDLMEYKKIKFEKNLLILGEMGPKVGVHIILSSRKPVGFSNIVKGAYETKISFKVNSDEESFAVLGINKASSLYGIGDMYLLKKDEVEPIRIEAPNITINEVEKVIDNIKDINNK